MAEDPDDKRARETYDLARHLPENRPKAPRTVGRIRAAGYVQIKESGDRRHYRTPDGREVSYRQAFKEVRGKSFERAVKDGGKFRGEIRLVAQARAAAREGLLSEFGIASKADERRIARATIKELVKGQVPVGEHPDDTKRRSPHRPKRTDAGEALKRSVLATLSKDVRRREGESVEAFLKRKRGERAQAVIGADSKKARLLVALGRRSPEADWDVGDS